MIYHFRVHGGRVPWAECMELEGCVTQGRNRAELKKNMAEALNLHLAEPETSTVIFPEPSRTVQGGGGAAKGIAAVEVDPQVAFAMVLRQARVRSRITQKEAARHLGMRSLYSYQRLERRCNPSLLTLKKVKALFPGLSLDDLV
jgi:hypothetical protein